MGRRDIDAILNWMLKTTHALLWEAGGGGGGGFHAGKNSRTAFTRHRNECL